MAKDGVTDIGVGHLIKALEMCKCDVSIEHAGNELSYCSNGKSSGITLLFCNTTERFDSHFVSSLTLGVEQPLIIYLSEYDEVSELLGLRMGAADVLHEKMSVNVICERIMAAHRRHNSNCGRPKDVTINEGRLPLPSFFLDVKRNEVWIDAQKFDFTATEVKIIDALMVRRGEIVSREELTATLQNTAEQFVQNRSVDSHIKRIRKKFRSNGAKIAIIQTVYGAGYRFAPTLGDLHNRGQKFGH